MGNDTTSITLADIEKAEALIRPYVRKTPILPFDYFNRTSSQEAWLKCELFQKTGSFKIRGAANCILSNMAQAKKCGVVAASAGNHAQGVASICHTLGIPATIVMPIPTPNIKILNTESWGAKVELVGQYYDEAYEHALKLAKEKGLLYVHPFRDPFIQAGQGTLGLELFDAPEFKGIESVVLSVGGGGLITGVGTALRAKFPKIKIYGVTARNAPAAYEAVKTKKPSDKDVLFTLAEGVATRRTEQVMMENISRHVDGIFSISEESIARAISVLAEQAKIVTEGAGALPVAAILDGLIPEKKVMAILSGGNIDLPALSSVLRRGLVEQGRLVSLVITIWDRPGGLFGITQVLAEKRANILEIHHQRNSPNTQMGETQVKVDIETKGNAHTDEIISTLTSRGYHVTKVR